MSLWTDSLLFPTSSPFPFGQWGEGGGRGSGGRGRTIVSRGTDDRFVEPLRVTGESVRPQDLAALVGRTEVRGVEGGGVGTWDGLGFRFCVCVLHDCWRSQGEGRWGVLFSFKIKKIKNLWIEVIRFLFPQPPFHFFTSHNVLMFSFRSSPRDFA